MAEGQETPQKEPSRRKKQEMQLQDVLRLIAPGTLMREAISFIIQSHNGALICIGNEKRFARLSEGGIQIDEPLRPQLLYELTKMDGAIILNDTGTRILYANRFLNPSNNVETSETGTRHRAAERMAKQTQATVIAVSERRSTVTVYCNDHKHILDGIATLMNKAAQAMQTLEKYINVLEQSMRDLTAREFQDMVTIWDVCRNIQRYEMVKRIAREIEPYLIELGTEGRLIEMQLRELMQSVSDADLVVKDYYRERQGATYESVQKRIASLSEDDLLEVSNISQALGYGTNLRNVEAYLIPRGYRVLSLTRRLTPQLIDELISKLGNLQAITRASMEDLCQIEGVGEVLADRLRVSINLLRSQVAFDVAGR